MVNPQTGVRSRPSQQWRKSKSCRLDMQVSQSQDSVRPVEGAASRALLLVILLKVAHV